MKHKSGMRKTDSPREYKLLKKCVDLSCSICRPHKGENIGRRAKHGPKKPKYKTSK